MARRAPPPRARLEPRPPPALDGREQHRAVVPGIVAAPSTTGSKADTVLAQRFRTLRSALTPLVSDRSQASDEWLTAVREIVAKRSPAAKEYRDLCRRLDADGTLTTSVVDILGSLVHMQVNRLMRSAPRAVELVIYDLLRRLYRSERARKGRA